MYEKLEKVMDELFVLSNKWFVVECRPLNKKELSLISKVGNYITPMGIEMELKDGRLIYLPYYERSLYCKDKDLKIILLCKVGESTRVRATFGYAPVECDDFTEVEKKVENLKKEKENLIHKIMEGDY